MWISSDSVAICFATLMGPILAVQIQRRIDRHKAQYDRRVGIYRTMMIERLSLSAPNLAAFNAIPLEFQGVESVLNAWREYLDHMEKAQDENWMNNRIDLFFALMQKIAHKLNFESDFVRIKKDYYSPKRNAIVESEQEQIRQGLAKLLSGTGKLPLDVQSFPGDPELNGLLKAWLRENTTRRQALPIDNAPNPSASA
jgi:hypothetical protein